LAQNFLRGDKKVDVPYSAIPSLFKQSAATRQRLCYYCVVDTVLPLRLLNHLKFFYGVIEMSRMVGCVFPSDIYVRGVQIKVFSATLRVNELDGHPKLFPSPPPDEPTIEIIEEGNVDELESDTYIETTTENVQQFHLQIHEGQWKMVPGVWIKTTKGKRKKTITSTVGFQGAVVIDPVRGFHENVICFDFASLYPSLHLAFNVSHDTEIPADKLADFPELTEADYIKSPSEDVYYVQVRKKQMPDGTVIKERQGFLPRVLEKMLADRKAVKREMKQHPPDSVQYSILDGKQRAIKIICNSVYGATGATGSLGHKEIGSTITALGREHLFLARDSVIREYPGSTCVGGDTDSLFVQIPGITCTADAVAREKEFSEFFATIFPSEMKLEYEKTFEKLLLIAKKRYISVIDGKIASKGVELVRRDQILFLQELLRAVIELIFFHKDIDGAIELIRTECKELLEGRVPLHKLITSRQISREHYKSKALPHVNLRQRMMDRGDRPPQLGERVAFLTIKGTRKEKNYQRAEDPDYVLEHELPLDYDYYLENKVTKPLIRVMQFFIYYDPRTARKRQHTGVYGRETQLPDQTDRERELEKEKHIHMLLFSGLTRKRAAAAMVEKHPMFRYAKPRHPCVACGRTTFDLVCTICQKDKDGESIQALRIRAKEDARKSAIQLEEQMSTTQ